MNLSASIIRHEAQRVSSAMRLRFMMRGLILAAAAWAASTAALVWYWTGYYCGALAHKYFVQWTVSWFFTEALPLPFVSLPYRGSRYPVDSLYPFLNQRIFRAGPEAWFAHYAGWGMLALLTPLVLVLLGLAAQRFHWSPASEHDSVERAAHVRGLKLISPRRLRRQLKGDGIVVAGVPIPHTREPEHFLIAGATGTGKSVAIRSMLRQIAKRGETAVVVDPECEFTPEFYRPARGDVLLNPLDARCPAWTPWEELDPQSFEVDAEMLAAAFIPDPAGAQGEGMGPRFSFANQAAP